MAKTFTPKTGLVLGKLKGKTSMQNEIVAAWRNDTKHVLIDGPAGTGKSRLAINLALEDVLDSKYQRIILLRSAVPTRDIGFLPGTLKEKTDPFFSYAKGICAEIFNRDDAFDILQTKGLFEVTTTSFLRGYTFNNAVIIIDESQNLDLHELNSVFTRISDSCRLVVIGDDMQKDNSRSSDNGFFYIKRLVANMPDWFNVFTLSIEDIVRGGFVKAFIARMYHSAPTAIEPLVENFNKLEL